MAFKKAVRSRLRARVGFVGPGGSGKSWWSLVLAYGLGERVAVIDSERGSASKFQGETDPVTGVRFDFDVSELDSCSPQTYVTEIQTAEREGYEVIVIDSLSHAWMGRDGALDQVDRIASRSQSKNNFMAWREVTPQHNALVDAITGSSCHVIVTMRAKTEYVIVDEDRGNGRTVKVPKKIGLAPVQRDGLEYEFDIVGDLDYDHRYAISKSRCPALDRSQLAQPGELARIYRGWLEKGSELAAPSAPRTVLLPQYAEPPPQPRGKLRPPARARQRQAEPQGPGAPAKFSSQASWPGADRWAGKPLHAADLGTLLDYSRHVELAATAALSDPVKLEMLKAHLGRIEAAIAAKEPSLALGDDPGGLASQGTCDTCPANPLCEHHARCVLAAAVASELDTETA
jgi:hypothetical protein